MSALRLKDKLDQVVCTNLFPIIKDVVKVYSHSEGYLTGLIHINNNNVKVSNTQGLWRISE